MNVSTVIDGNVIHRLLKHNSVSIADFDNFIVYLKFCGWKENLVKLKKYNDTYGGQKINSD